MNSLPWLVDDYLVARLSSALLHFLWQGCLLGAIAVLGGALLRGRSAQLRYYLYVGTLAAMAACLPVTFLLLGPPAFATNLVDADMARGMRSPSGTEVDDRASPRHPSPPVISGLIAGSSSTESSVPNAEITAARRGSNTAKVSSAKWRLFSESLPHRLVTPARWIAMLYLTGVAAFLARLGLGMCGANRLRRMTIPVEDAALLSSLRMLANRIGLPDGPAIAWCAHVSIPVVVGIMRPTILLPLAITSSLTPDQLHALLLHELAHIRRFDPIIHLVQRIVEAMLFFHPAVWIVSRRICIERERAADDMVLAAGWDRPRYADALLRVAELATGSASHRLTTGAASLASVGTSPSEFKLRILRLVEPSPAGLAISRVGIFVTLAFVATGGLLAWSQVPTLLATANPVDPPTQSPAVARSQSSGTDDKSVAVEIPQVGAAETPVSTRTLQTPAVLLPDRWVLLAVGFDNEARELVTASAQGFVTIRRWDVPGKKLLSEIKLTADKHGRRFHSETLMLSADRQRVIASTDAYVGMWETATGKLIQKLSIPTIAENDTVHLLTATPDFSVIVGNLETNYERTTLVYDAYTVVWDGANGKLLRTNRHQAQNRFRAMSLSPDGKRLATTNGGAANVWDVNTGDRILQVPNDEAGAAQNWSIQYSPSGNELAVGNTLGVRLVDAASGKLIHSLDGPYSFSSGLGSVRLVFSRNGQQLARLGTGRANEGVPSKYVVSIWSTQSGQKQFELQTDANAGDFSVDSKQFAVGRSDMQQALSVWSLDPDAADPGQPEGPGPESRQDKVEENGHYRGKTVSKFIETFKPIWGESEFGIEYGIALTRKQLQYRGGERIPLVAFFRNTSDRPLKVDMRPDFFGNAPKVVNAKGETVELANLPLLGHIPHYVEELGPGEAVGPFYLSFGLGENPRPGKQHWHPYYRAPISGKYSVTHHVGLEISVVGQDDDRRNAEIASGEIQFEIAPVDDGQNSGNQSAETQTDRQEDVPSQLGKISAVKEQELVEIAIGARDRMKVGQTLIVHRADKYLGKVTIVRVGAESSVARIESRNGEIRSGDQVAAWPEGQIPDNE